MFPLDKHVVSLLNKGRFFLSQGLSLVFIHTTGYVLCLELCTFVLVMLIKKHVEIAYEVVAFLSSRLGRTTVTPLYPRQHRLHNMDTTVVDNVGFDNPVAVGLHNFSQRPAKQVVANVP